MSNVKISGVKISGVKLLVLAVLMATAASAHVGSPDIFFQGKAGPYPILVAIRPPDVIPGVAHVEIRSQGTGVQRIEITPMPMRGEGAKHPPIADVAERSAADANFYEGQLWLMGFGSWQVKIRVTGAQGFGELPVPVPAMALKTKPMDPAIGYFLFGMMAFLTVGMVAIAGAGVREAQVEPGVTLAGWNRKSIAAMGIASLLLIGMLWKGKSWWGDEAAVHDQQIYKPLAISGTLEGSSQLQLQLQAPGWFFTRKLDDFAPDHGHLMHLFLVRWPAMDRVYHLHPEQTATGYFMAALPAIPAGTYRMYGDVVHSGGFPETAVGEVKLPDVTGRAVGPDDAVGLAVPVSEADVRRAEFDLGDGYRMVWDRPQNKKIIARQVQSFAFQIVGRDGKPVDDLQPYMEMGGHAEFVKTDGSVFAHVHPTGSVPMASVAVASNEAMLRMHQAVIGREVTFPYGLPSAGRYRVFVQMKRAGKIETGVFDLEAEAR